MNNWEKNAVIYDEQGSAGVCPKCGSEDIVVKEHIHGIRKSLSFLCKNCKSGDHFDGFIESPPK